MSVGGAIKGFFIKLWHLFTEVEKDALQKFEEKIAPEFWAAAKNGVIAAFAALLKDTEARDKAIELAKEELVQAGKDIAILALDEWHTLIQLVYTSNRADLIAKSHAQIEPTEGVATGS